MQTISGPRLKPQPKTLVIVHVAYVRLRNCASGPRTGLSGACFAPGLAASILRPDKKLVPHCPGFRPGQFGTGLWPCALGLRPKPAQNLIRGPEALLLSL